MENEIKQIDVYIDKNNNLYSTPIAVNRKRINPIDKVLDILDMLNPPYDTEKVEDFLLMSLSKSFSFYNGEIEKSEAPLEKHFNVKSWAKAVKGLRYVSVTWSTSGGYIIAPMRWNKKHGGYFEGISGAYPEKPIHNTHYAELGIKPEKGAIGEAFLKAVALSTTN